MPTPEQAAQLADLGGAAISVFLVTLATVGLHRQWWAPYWVIRSLEKRLRDIEAENEAWRSLALRGLRDADGGRVVFSERHQSHDQTD